MYKLILDMNATSALHVASGIFLDLFTKQPKTKENWNIENRSCIDYMFPAVQKELCGLAPSLGETESDWTSLRVMSFVHWFIGLTFSGTGIINALSAHACNSCGCGIHSRLPLLKSPTVWYKPLDNPEILAFWQWYDKLPKVSFEHVWQCGVRTLLKPYQWASALPNVLE